MKSVATAHGRAVPFGRNSFQVLYTSLVLGFLFASQPGMRVLSAEPPDDIASEARYLLQRHQNQFLVRDRSDLVLLKSMRQQLEAGQNLNAIEIYQKICDRGEDSVFWEELASRPTSVRAAAAELFEQQSSEVWSTYSKLYNDAASSFFDRLSEQNATLAEVCTLRRYFHTSTARRIITRQAVRAMDAGEYRLAESLLSRLWQSSFHREKLTAGHKSQWELVQRLSGAPISTRDAVDDQRRFEGMRHVAHKVADGTREIRQADTLRAKLAFQQHRSVLLDEWNQATGSPNNNASRTASRPYFRPIWKSVSDTSEPPALLDQDWQQHCLEDDIPPASVHAGIRLGNSELVFRTAVGLQAISLKSGRTVWKHASPIQSTVTLSDGKESRSDAVLKAYAAKVRDNSVDYHLSTNGELVFFVEETMRSIQNAEQESKEVPHRRLAALRVARSLHSNRPSTVEPAWQTDQNAGKTSDLQNHEFLGPPLVQGNCVFAVTECNQKISLVVLATETGKLLWKQGLAIVANTQNSSKAVHQACTPMIWNDSVICPTPEGLIIAVDRISGNLKWTTEFADHDDSYRGSRRYHSQRKFGHLGFYSPAVLHGEKLFVLSDHSDQLYCCDVRTGLRNWAVDRHDGEYIGVANDQIVLVVGHRFVRAFGSQSGKSVWKCRAGTPSGRGVCTKDSYLLPLASGDVCGINLKTGEMIGAKMSQWRPESQTVTANEDAATEPDRDEATLTMPGNLMVCEDLLVSFRPTSIAAFRQSKPMLQETYARLNAEPSRLDYIVHAAELEMIQGREQRAKDLLRIALADHGEVNAIDQQAFHHNAESLMRGLLFAEWHQQNTQNNRKQLLEELDRLAKTPGQRARYLAMAASSQLDENNFDALRMSLRDFQSLKLKRPFSLNNTNTYQISGGSWLSGTVAKLHRQMDATERRSLVTDAISEFQSAIESGQLADLQRLHRTYSGLPEGGVIGVQLAAVYAREGQFHKAESLLLRYRQSKKREVAAHATRHLVELWDRLGFTTEAGRLLWELATDFGDIEVQPGITGHDFVTHFSSTSPTYDAYLAHAPVELDEDANVVIRSQWTSRSSGIEKANFRSYRYRFPVGPGRSFEVFDRGTGSSSRLSLVDRLSGTVRGDFTVPARCTVGDETNVRQGGFLPIAGDGQAMGVSLLEQRVVWTRQLAARNRRSQKTRVGPAGVGYATFQSGQRLVVLDPTSGNVKWKRSDLEPHCGLDYQHQIGIVGDELGLVFFEGNEHDYTLYRTQDGSVMRTGKLDPKAEILTRTRESFGRNLLYLAETRAGRHWRLWEPISNRMLVDVAVSPRNHYATSSDRSLFAVVDHTNTVRVFETNTGRERISYPLDDEVAASINRIKVFDTSETLYVNLELNRTVHEGEVHSYPVREIVAPTVHFRGELLAFSEKDGRHLWTKSFPYRSLLRMETGRMPFLVMMATLRNSQRHRSPGMLVEVVCAKTGKTLAENAGCILDRIASSHYDPTSRCIRLIGMSSEISISFDDAGQTPLRLLRDSFADAGIGQSDIRYGVKRKDDDKELQVPPPPMPLFVTTASE